MTPTLYPWDSGKRVMMACPNEGDRRRRRRIRRRSRADPSRAPQPERASWAETPRRRDGRPPMRGFANSFGRMTLTRVLCSQANSLSYMRSRHEAGSQLIESATRPGLLGLVGGLGLGSTTFTTACSSAHLLAFMRSADSRNANPRPDCSSCWRSALGFMPG